MPTYLLMRTNLLEGEKAVRGQTCRLSRRRSSDFNASGATVTDLHACTVDHEVDYAAVIVPDHTQGQSGRLRRSTSH